VIRALHDSNLGAAHRRTVNAAVQPETLCQPTVSGRYRTARPRAEVEGDPHVAEVYRRLAGVEEAHAELWRKRLEASGALPGTLRPGWRNRTLAFLARRFGPAFVLPTLNTMEQLDSRRYDRQSDAAAAGLPQAERSHARLLKAIAGGRDGGMPGATLARLEGRHRSGGNALRAAVLGANDGLVSNLSLVAGVAGAAVEGHALLVTGLAGLIAGACSMAMGEWLSVTSARELYQSQIATESDELAQSPDEEKEELVLIYQSKGLGEAQAKALAEQLMASHGTAIDALAREELGIDPEALGGSAWAAAGVSFGLFALGAVVPVAPFLFLQGQAALFGAFVASALALFTVGAATSLFTGRGLVFSGLRQLAFGLGAAAITYGIGLAVGVRLGN